MSACKYELPKTIKDLDFLILSPWNCCIKEIVRCNGKVVELGRVDAIPDLLLSMGGRVIKIFHHSDNICFYIWTTIFVMGIMMYDPQLVYVPLLCSPPKTGFRHISRHTFLNLKCISGLEFCLWYLELWVWFLITEKEKQRRMQWKNLFPSLILILRAKESCLY